MLKITHGLVDLLGRSREHWKLKNVSLSDCGVQTHAALKSDPIPVTHSTSPWVRVKALRHTVGSTAPIGVDPAHRFRKNWSRLIKNEWKPTRKWLKPHDSQLRKFFCLNLVWNTSRSDLILLCCFASVCPLWGTLGPVSLNLEYVVSGIKSRFRGCDSDVFRPRGHNKSGYLWQSKEFDHNFCLETSLSGALKGSFPVLWNCLWLWLLKLKFVGLRNFPGTQGSRKCCSGLDFSCFPLYDSLTLIAFPCTSLVCHLSLRRVVVRVLTLSTPWHHVQIRQTISCYRRKRQRTIGAAAEATRCTFLSLRQLS